jgi:hypothetical protein
VAEEESSRSFGGGLTRKGHSVSYWKVGRGESGKVRGGKCKVQIENAKCKRPGGRKGSNVSLRWRLARGNGIFLKGRIKEASPFSAGRTSPTCLRRRCPSSSLVKAFGL